MSDGLLWKKKFYFLIFRFDGLTNMDELKDDENDENIFWKLSWTF